MPQSPMQRYLQGFQFGMGFLNDILRRQMQQQEFGQKERYYEMMEPYYAAMTEKMGREEPSIEEELRLRRESAQSQLQEELRLRRESEEAQAAQQWRDTLAKVQRYNLLERTKQMGLLRGPETTAEYRALSSMFGEKPQVAKPQITVKELLNKTQTISAAGTPIELTPELKFMRLIPFENLDEATRAEVDKAYESLGMPTSATRKWIIGELKKGGWGDSITAVENIMSLYGYDRKTAEWLVEEAQKATSAVGRR